MHKHNIFFLPIALLLSFLVLFSCNLDTEEIKDQLEDQSKDQLPDTGKIKDQLEDQSKNQLPDTGKIKDQLEDQSKNQLPDTGKIKDQLEDQSKNQLPDTGKIKDQLEDKAQLSPPSWIYGTWQHTVDGSVTLSFEFTADDMIIEASGVTSSFKDLPAAVVKEQTNTNTVYTVKITKSSTKTDVSDGTYKFEKKTASTLDYTFNDTFTEGKPITFSKQ